MSSALRYELMRIGTVRSTYWLAGIGVTIAFIIAFFLAIDTYGDTPSTQTITAVVLGGGEFAAFNPFFVGIIGIMAVGHEYRYGTIQPTLTAVPQRAALLIAKILTVSLVAVATVAVSLALNISIGLLVWQELPELGSDPLNQVVPGYVVMTVLYGICGLAFALLFRGVPWAIVLLLMLPFVGELLIIWLSGFMSFLIPLLKFLPFTAGYRLIATESSDWISDDLYGRWASGGVFAAFVAVLLAIGWYRFQTRDI